MTAALGAARDRRRRAVADDHRRSALAVFGLGFGLVGQVLVVAVQNDVDRARLGVAMATTTSSAASAGRSARPRSGAVFAAEAGSAASPAAVIDGVQAVFLVAAPLAAIGLVIALFLPDPRPMPDIHPTTQGATR